MNQADNHSLITYDVQLSRLEQIVADMEDGHLSLEDALAQYEQGIMLVRQCQSILDTAEQKIHILTQDVNEQKESLKAFNEGDQ